MKSIIFSLEIDGVTQAITNQNQLTKAVKEVKDALNSSDINSPEYQKLNGTLAKATQFQKDLRKSTRDAAKDLVATGQTGAGAYQQLSTQLNIARGRVKDLAAAGKANTEEFKDQIKAVQGLDKKLKDIDESVGQYQRSIGNYREAFSEVFNGLNVPDLDSIFGPSGLSAIASKLPKALGPIAGIASGVGAIGVGLFEINAEFAKLDALVSQITGATGPALASITANAKAVADTFDEDFNQVVIAANKLAKDFEVSYNDAFQAIETGFLAGANSQGDFLDVLKEYPSQVANAGFSLEEFIKLQIESQKRGIFSDKLIDSIKEADLSLKEFTKSQQDALSNAFGPEFAESINQRIKDGSLTTKNAIIEISKQAKQQGLDFQQLQTITADVFKGAGEDAGGFGIIAESVFNAVNGEFSNLVDTSNEYIRNQKNLLDANKELANSQLTLSLLLNDFGISFDVIGAQLKTFGNDILGVIIAKFESFASVIEALYKRDLSLIRSEFELLAVAQARADAETKKNEESLREYKKTAKDSENAAKGLSKAVNDSAKALKDQAEDGSINALKKEIQSIQSVINNTTDRNKLAEQLQEVAEKKAALEDLQKTIDRLPGTDLNKIANEQSGFEDELFTGSSTPDLLSTDISDSKFLEDLQKEEELQRLSDQLKLELAQEKINADAELEETANEARLARLQEFRDREAEILQERENANIEFGNAVGEAFGNLLTGQLDSFEDFSKDLLTASLDLALKQLQIDAVAAVGRELGSKGLLGIVTGAAVTGFFEVLRRQLRGVIAEDGIEVLSGGRIDKDGIARGRRHSQGGILTKLNGVHVEIEDGEKVDRFRNGTVKVHSREDTHKIMKAAALSRLNGTRIRAVDGITVPQGVVQSAVRRNERPGLSQEELVSIASSVAKTVIDQVVPVLRSEVRAGAKEGSMQGTNTGLVEANRQNIQQSEIVNRNRL